MPDLRSKTAIVTGATSGIGEACALELARLGATVVMAVRSATKAQATLQRIKEACPGAAVVLGPLVDFSDPDSIRAFAADYLRQGRPLHILINNAGAYDSSRNYTKGGVAELCQVNYLGAYLLTRLLEGVLVASAPSRVVNVSSVTHRMGVIGADPRNDFLQGDFGHYYWNTKLGNVLFAYELQRRLGKHGVQSCAVDPGGVRTNVWREANLLIKAVVNVFYAPAEAGAEVLVYAAAAPWDTAGDRVRGAGRAAQLAPDQDLRYYAPQAFTSPLVCWYAPEGNQGMLGGVLMRWFGFPSSTPWGAIKQSAWTLTSTAVSLVDWPLRRLSGGKLLQGVRLVASSPLTYDAELARALWDASADVAGMPRECLVAAADMPGAAAAAQGS